MTTAREGVTSTLYIAGPMSGYPQFNYPAFNAAARVLIERGFHVLNPARRGYVDGWQWVDYMRPALRDVADCDGIAVLAGWRESKGASLEVHVAEVLGLPVKPVDAWLRRSA